MRSAEYGIWVMLAAAAVVQAAPPAGKSKAPGKAESRPAATPAGSVEAMLAERETLLERYADESLSVDQRHAALVEANALLEKITEYQRDDPRTGNWRFDLGRSLLYQEAEPYSLNILYRGGTAADRRKLAQLMERTAGVLALARADVAREFQRMERMAPGKYEEQERAGQVDKLENLLPKIAYMERWVKFYRAIAREEKDPLMAKELGEVLDELRTRSGLLDAPHRESHVQAQAKLLAGMAARRLGEDVPATRDLQSAVEIVRRITQARERADLAWVVRLAMFEIVKLHRDRGQFDLAWDALRQLQSEASAGDQEAFGVQLAAAIVAGSIHDTQGKEARDAGKLDEARKYDNMRYEPLMHLARRGHAERSAVYAAVYETLGPKADPADMHPFAGCALVAGLLADASGITAQIAERLQAGEASTSAGIEDLETQRTGILDRAIAAAEHFQAQRERVPPELRSEIAYGLASAQFQRGHRLEAARGFMAIARDDPRFRLAEHSAIVAVQIGSEMAEDPSLRDRPEVRELHVEAMMALTAHYPESQDARYWQFFLAQTLFENGRFEEAAEAYARVAPDHDYALQAAFLRVRALAGAVTSQSGDLDKRVSAVLEAALAFREKAETARAGGADPGGLTDFLAEMEVLEAEAKLALGPAEGEWVAEKLKGFEDRYPDRGKLVGRVLRARILAFEHLDRWTDAERAIPDYVRREPRSAGATLQGLFESVRREIEGLQERGQAEEARRKTASALLLAREIHALAHRPESGLDAENLYAVDMQLAEALLGAGLYAEARDVFARCMEQDARGHEDGRSRDIRAIQGQAEARFMLKSYEAALPLFNRLSRESQPGDPIRFPALLRDLQCRTELNHPPEGIIKVIRQQKFLDSEMGGDDLRAQFDELLSRNEERARTEKGERS